MSRVARLFTVGRRSITTERLSAFPASVQAEARQLFKISEKIATEKALQSSFHTARSWLIQDTLLKSLSTAVHSPETYQTYTWLSYLTNAAVQRHYENTINKKAAKLTETTKTVIAPIFTRHPCCPNPYVYPVLGSLIEGMENKDENAVKKAVEALQTFDSRIPVMTLKKEILLNFPLIKNLLLAVVEHEMEHDLPPGSVARPQNWGGYDGDRAPVTGEVVLATQILETQYVLQVYQEQLKTILEMKEMALRPYVEALENLFKEIDAIFDPAWRLVKTKAIIYVNAFEHEGGKLKRDTINQFFAGNAQAIPDFIEGTESLFREWGKTLSSDPALACSQLDQEIQTIFHHVFSRLPACLQGLQILQREASAGKVSIEVRRKVQALYHFFKNAGFHMTEGQGRLGSEVIVPACHALLEADGFPVDHDFVDTFLHAVETYAGKPPCSLEELKRLPSDAQNVLKYFQSIAFLNSIHTRNMPVLVLANFSGPESFLCAFYLALRTGLIKIRDGKVIESKITIVPLLESPEDHFQVARWFEVLCKQSLIYSYYTCIQEFIWMTAFSDTPRERGIVEALVSIEMATHEVYQTFQRIFPDVFRLMLYRHQLGRGSSGLRSGEVGIDLTTRRHSILNTVLSRTLQSGESDDAFSTPDRARLWLESELKLLEKYPAYDKRKMELFRDFAEPGAEAFQKLVMDPKGQFNLFLLKLRETEYILNHAPLGSRKNAPADLSKLPQSIVGGQRMISIVRLLANELQCYVHAFYPFAVSVEAFLASGEKIETLQKHYVENIFFQRLIAKLEELVYFSSDAVIERYRDLDPELVNDLIQKRKTAVQFLLQISGQSSLLERRSELKKVWEWRKGQEEREAVLKAPLYVKAGLHGLFNNLTPEETAARENLARVSTSSIFSGRYA